MISSPNGFRLESAIGSLVRSYHLEVAKTETRHYRSLQNLRSKGFLKGVCLHSNYFINYRGRE